MIGNQLNINQNKPKNVFNNVFSRIKLQAIDKSLIDTQRIDNTLTGIFERLKNLSPNENKENQDSLHNFLYNKKLSKSKINRASNYLKQVSNFHTFSKTPKSEGKRELMTIDYESSQKQYKNIVLKTCSNSPRVNIPSLPKLSSIPVIKNSVFVNKSKLSKDITSRSNGDILKKSFSFFIPVSKNKFINVN
jgi:hypothetical protein